MKKYVLICLTLLSALAHGGEVYTSGEFWAPCNNPGRDCRFGLELDMTFDNGQISGKVINMFGVNACRWQDVPISGVVDGQGAVRWRSEKHPTQGCGTLIFNGKQEGDKIVGSFPRFQGKQVDLTLSKKAP